MSEPEEIDDAIVATLSDYLDGALPAAERDEVVRCIETDETWKRAHEELQETRKVLSGMQKARAPASFAQEVTSTIHKRSAGRFFGRRTLGDRVPFAALLVVAVLALAVIGYVMWSSQTGSLRVHEEHGATQGGSGELVPRP